MGFDSYTHELFGGLAPSVISVLLLFGCVLGFHVVTCIRNFHILAALTRGEKAYEKFFTFWISFGGMVGVSRESTFALGQMAIVLDAVDIINRFMLSAYLRALRCFALIPSVSSQFAIPSITILFPKEGAVTPDLASSSCQPAS